MISKVASKICIISVNPREFKTGGRDSFFDNSVCVGRGLWIITREVNNPPASNSREKITGFTEKTWLLLAFIPCLLATVSRHYVSTSSSVHSIRQTQCSVGRICKKTVDTAFCSSDSMKTLACMYKEVPVIQIIKLYQYVQFSPSFACNYRVFCYSILP